MSEENNALNKKQMTEQRNVANNAKNVQVAADIAAKSGNPYAVAAGKAVKVADKISGGKASENIGKTINNLNKMNGIQGKMMQGALNKMGESGALNRLRAAQDKKNSGLSSIFGGKKNSEGIKEPSELSNDTSENDDKPAEGMVNFKIPKSVKKGILYASPFLALIIVFSCLFIAASQTYLNVIGLDDANKSSAQIDDEIYNSTDEEKNQEIKDEDATVYNYNITINKKKYASSYFLVNANSLKKTNNGLNLSDLKDHYGDSSDMKTVNKFFIKLNDIYTRYSIKQNVYLDLPLLMSTLTIQSKDMDYVFKSNTSEKYDRKDIDKVDTHILDYTHDWTGYKITSDNSAHDIEILAQNMVSADANGNYYIDYEKYDEFLKEFLEKKYFIKGGGVYNGTPDLSNSSDVCTTTFTKYNLTEEQLKQISSLAYHEQGTVKGSAAEASLMANLFELKGSKYGEGADGLYNYIRNSGWFANSKEFMDSKDASDEIINAVKSVLVEGKRILPSYIDEHDILSDIISAKTDETEIAVENTNLYVSNKTKLTNKYGSQYTFYSFPDTYSDPFGYTSEKIKEEKGEFYFDFDTGKPQNCDSNSSSKTELSSAFVSLAVSQLNDPSKNGGEKYWRFMGFNSRVAWCASFVSWNIYNTNYNGQKLSDIIKKKTATVDTFMNYFHDSEDSNINFYYNDNCSNYKGKNGKNSTYMPKEGDLIFFDNNSKWNGKFPVSRSNLPNRHVGIVQYVKDGQVITIEGNSNNKTKENKFSLSSCRIIGFGSWY